MSNNPCAVAGFTFALADSVLRRPALGQMGAETSQPRAGMLSVP